MFASHRSGPICFRRICVKAAVNVEMCDPPWRAARNAVQWRNPATPDGVREAENGDFKRDSGPEIAAALPAGMMTIIQTSGSGGKMSREREVLGDRGSAEI